MFNRIVSTADAGIKRRNPFGRKGSLPAMAPMLLELTARPTQPQVITKPIAVPVRRGKPVSVMAGVVGKTGSVEGLALNTNAPAAAGLTVRSMRNVVIAMAMETTSRT